MAQWVSALKQHFVSLDFSMYKKLNVKLRWLPPHSLVSQPHLTHKIERKTPAVYVLQNAYQSEESRDLVFPFY